MPGSTVAILMLGLALGADAPAEALKNEHAALNGTWFVETATIGRQKGPIQGMKLTFKPDGKLQIEFQGKKNQGSYKLNISRTPREIDLTSETSRGKLETAPGIYEFKDGKLLVLTGTASTRVTNDGKKMKEETVPPKRPVSFNDKTALLMTLAKEVPLEPLP